MLTRKEIEKREAEFLATYAVPSKNSKGRAYHEKEHPYRTAFQRDKDRIIFSAAFRRLQYKTQVFSNFEGDYYRTRLTHTLEVSQISRSVARTLRVNEDLSEAIALAHDVGHGPFGHIGEKILNECMKAHGGFEHNRQSLRIVEVLEDIYSHGKGLNLTWETKEGLQKHTYSDTDASVPVNYSTLESQIVDVADEIAYNSHDLDDGLRAGLFTENDLHDLRLIRGILDKIKAEHLNINRYQYVHLLIRYLINEQVTDLLKESDRRINDSNIETREDVKAAKVRIIDFSEGMKKKKKEIKEFLYENFYLNPHVIKIVDLAKECLNGLFEIYIKDPSKMPTHFCKKSQVQGEDPYRIICDYVSGMTDRFAYDEYKRQTKE